MITFIRSLLVVAFISIFQLTYLQAQQAQAILVKSEQAVNQATTPTPTPKLDLAAGQKAAVFENLEQYVVEHLKYPASAQQQAIEGSVSVLAIISAEGKIIDAKVVKPLGFGCDEAALKLIKEMPNWQPASNLGIAVKSKKILDFNFRLQ